MFSSKRCQQGERYGGVVGMLRIGAGVEFLKIGLPVPIRISIRINTDKTKVIEFLRIVEIVFIGVHPVERVVAKLKLIPCGDSDFVIICGKQI